MLRRFGLFLLMLLMVMVSHSPVYADSQSHQEGLAGYEEQIKRLVRDKMAEGNIPGLSLVIVRNGQTVMSEGFGYADKQSKRRVTEETEFQLGSLSKAFTGLAITHLAAEHKLELDRLVSYYLPWFQPQLHHAPSEITLNQLMEHASGFGTEKFIDIPASPDEEALEQGVRTLANAPLDSAPGEKYAYSNVNFNILGLLIEKVSGQTYADYMNEHIFMPLELLNTSVRKDQPTSNLATGYKVALFGAHPYTVPFSQSQAPAGSIQTNAKDMAKWLSFNLGVTRVEGYEAVHPAAATPFHYYGGWEFDADSNQIQHAGNLENYSSYIVLDPREQTGIAVMANLNSTYTTAIGEGVMSLLQDRPGSAGDSDIYLLTDRISSSLILIMGSLSIVMLWPMRNVVKDMRTGRRVFRIRTLPVFVSAILLSVLVSLYFLAIRLPTFIYPNADWSFVNDWLPNTTQYGIICLLSFLTLLTVNMIARLVFRVQQQRLTDERKVIE